MRVADFGLSRVTHDLNTLTGGLGTFQYMAPKVMANQRYLVTADMCTPLAWCSGSAQPGRCAKLCRYSYLVCCMGVCDSRM